jgi:hypothetical protein
MSFNKKLATTSPLPFVEYNCSNCPLKKQGYCDGVEDLQRYSMEHESLIGCYDLKRIDKFLSEIFDRLILPPETFHQEKVNLSELPFGVTYGGLDLTQYKDVPIFVVSMGEFFKESGDLAFRDMAHLKEKLKIPPNAKVALIGTSSEKIQQAFWRNLEKLNLLERIANFGFEWMTSPTFPVYDLNPRADQIIHQFRNYLVTDLMATYGLPIIPFIFPYNDVDYRTFSKWLDDRPSINKIAILAQFYESDAQFSQLIKNIEEIQKYAKRQLEFLIVGVTKKSKLETALSNLKNVSIISWSPYFEAFLKGKLYDTELKSVQRLDLSKPSVAYENYLTFKQVISELRDDLSIRN